MVIREASKNDLDKISKIQVDSWNTTYVNLIPGGCLSTRSYEGQRAKWARRLEESCNKKEFIYVAEIDKGEIVGFASGSLCSPGSILESSLHSIYILKEYQGKGMGKALFKTVAEKLREEGAGNIYLWTLRGTPSCGFYEHMGGIMIEIKPAAFAEKELMEAAYFWKDINFLINNKLAEPEGQRPKHILGV